MIWPSPGMASTAFRTRFVNTSRSSEMFPATSGIWEKARAMSTRFPCRCASSAHRPRVISSTSSSTVFKFTGRKSRSVRKRVNSWMRWTVAAPSCAAFSMMRRPRRISSSCTRRASSCARARIAPSTLLKSWATPLAISPSARNRSLETIFSWSWRCSVTSTRIASIAGAPS